GNDRQHRPEDLLARNGHVVADVCEQRRPHEPAGEPVRPAFAAGEQRALVDTDTDITLNAIPLPLADHRADRRLRIAWITGLDLSDRRLRKLFHLAEPAPWREDACAGDAR